MTTRFGLVLKAARQKAKVTQSHLAKSLGYESSQFISNVERGLVFLPNSKIIKAASVVDVPVKKLADAKVWDFKQKVFEAVGL